MSALRYDLQWLPDPIQLDANNVSPRIGVAYAPGDGKTVVRASGGLYFDRIPLRATSNALQRDGSKYQVAVLVVRPGWRARCGPTCCRRFRRACWRRITTIDPDIQDRPHRAGRRRRSSARSGASRRRRSATAYLRGHGIIMSRNINVPTLTAAQAAALGMPNLGRPNPDFGNISQYDSIGDSWFNGLTLSLATRPAAWGNARVSYTLSQALDDAGNAFFQTPQDNFNMLARQGAVGQRSAPPRRRERHGRRRPRSRCRGRSIGRCTGSSSAMSGRMRPARRSRSSPAATSTTTRTQRRPAGVGRNSERLPSTSSFDLRVSRTFAMSGGAASKRCSKHSTCSTT